MKIIGYLLVGMLLSASAFSATPSISASPASGTGSVTPTITWSCDAGSTPVVASGGWSGSKAVSGSQVQAVITTTTTYTISCTPPVVTTAQLTWVAPTQNTDGSAITDLSGYKIYKGSSAGSLSQLTQLPGAATLAYTATALGLGTTYFAVSAYNTAGAESAKSAVGSKVITAPVAQTASVVVTVSTVPNPPVLTVVQTAAYKMRQEVDGYSMVAIGTVPLGTVCSDKSVDGYNIVPRDLVKMASRFDTKPVVVYARCG